MSTIHVPLKQYQIRKSKFLLINIILRNSKNYLSAGVNAVNVEDKKLALSCNQLGVVKLHFR